MGNNLNLEVILRLHLLSKMVDKAGQLLHLGFTLKLTYQQLFIPTAWTVRKNALITVHMPGHQLTLLIELGVKLIHH